MSTEASWLKHPHAVDQRFFVADGFDGAYKCKTNRGSLQIWHHSPKNTLAPNGLKVAHTFEPEETEIIELARQDPRHAIAAFLQITVSDLQEQELSASPGSYYGSRGGGVNAMLTRSS